MIFGVNFKLLAIRDYYCNMQYAAIGTHGPLGGGCLPHHPTFIKDIIVHNENIAAWILSGGFGCLGKYICKVNT